MKKRLLIFFMVQTLMSMSVISIFAQAKFGTSLHATRVGKNYWYGKDTSVTGAPSPGFESLTNVPIDHENLACTQCHPGDNLDANGNPYETPYPGASCTDCHATNTTGMPVTEGDCLGCHGRQGTEMNTLGYSDVHRDASTPLKCWDCHKKEELHGDDGVEYNSMLEPGAMKAKCEDCHTTVAGTLPDHSSYDPHSGKLDCDACHAQTVISCYNCHFESQVESHVKRAKQPIHDFVMLANIEKSGKVGTITFQSLSYQGNTWSAFAPYHSHTITDEGRQCNDCHANFGGQIEAISQYNSTGEVKFATWNDGDSTLTWLHGVVPFPEDYETSFKMDFITYNGNTSDPAGPSKNWSAIGEDTWDGHQMFFATPLSKDQMSKLGMTEPTVAENFYMGVGAASDAAGSSCASCHNANSFASPVFDEWTQTKHAIAQDSLAFLTYSCLSCHNTGWDTEKDNHGADEYVMEDAGAPFGWSVTDQANWDRVKNVQCETCHGPLGNGTGGVSSDHNTPAGAPNFSAEVCGVCHEGSHHPTYSEWQTSKHAFAKATTIPGGRFDFIASDPNCSACHTAEGFIQFVETTDLEPHVEAPGDAGNDITCSACHDPHGGEHACQLRMDVVDICAKCHNPEYSPDTPTPDGSDLHHTTAYMYEGKGGYEYLGYSYSSSAHKFLIADKCVSCHVFETPFVGEPEEIPAYTGHSFEAHLGSCAEAGCHEGSFNVADSSFDYRGVQTEIDSLLNVLHTALSRATVDDSSTDEFYRAKFNYDFVYSDGSLGIHNTRYARDLLTSAIENFIPSAVSENRIVVPTEYNLGQNYPNPFNPTTRISFALKQPGRVTLTLYNAVGQVIQTIVDKNYAAGVFEAEVNGKNLSSGMYFYQIEISDGNGVQFKDMKKMVLMK